LWCLAIVQPEELVRYPDGVEARHFHPLGDLTDLRPASDGPIGAELEQREHDSHLE
jgi:hypothetical protein